METLENFEKKTTVEKTIHIGEIALKIIKILRDLMIISFIFIKFMDRSNIDSNLVGSKGGKPIGSLVR